MLYGSIAEYSLRSGTPRASPPSVPVCVSVPACACAAYAAVAETPAAAAAAASSGGLRSSARNMFAR